MKFWKFSLVIAIAVMAAKKGDGSATEKHYRLSRIAEVWRTGNEDFRVEHSNGSDLSALMSRFSRAFKKCLFVEKKRIVSSGPEGKNIIFKCFGAELVKQIRAMLNESGSISFLNGYLQLEKAKLSNYEVSSNKVLNDLDDSLRDNEILANGTAEDLAMYSRYQKEVLREIVYDLEHEDEEERSLIDSISGNSFLSVLENLTRQFALRINLSPGVSTRMQRSKSSGVTFDLELDDLAAGFGGDDDDDDDDKTKNIDKDEESDEDNEEEAYDDEEEDNALIKGKGKGKKKKQKYTRQNKQKKKKMKLIKKIGPYLLIPIFIQAIMLPMAFKFLLFFAIKALVAGKIALLLVGLNLIKNANFKSDEDEYIERVGQSHYGYGSGVEYGAWFNGRSFQESGVPNHPYRAYASVTKAV